MTRRVLASITALVLLPASVQAQYFGRNKVQYRSFDFQIIRTEHFDVYYYDQERKAAMDAARMAERSYARLSGILQHEFQERKPIILYASHTDFQQTNALYGFVDEGTGGVTESLKSRVILPFTGSYPDFDHVLTHELVHAFQYDVIFQGGATNSGSRLPLWFMEGMAEYLSIGRIDPLTISWLRDATLNGYLRTIGEMSIRDDYLSYRFGQSLWAYIGAKWGDEMVGILLQRAPHTGIERAFEASLGITLQQLSDEWITAVRKTYLPQVTDYVAPERFAQKLTHHNDLGDAWFLAPAISPDGKKMVYLSQRDGFSFDLWLADAQTGRPLKKLIRAAHNANFESLRYLNSGAAFSPNGRYLAFAAQTGGRDALYLYDLKTGRVVRKLKLMLDGIESPSFAADGEHIVFTGLVGGISDLFITDLKGKLTRLTDDRYADLTPSWSPDGRTIAFSTDRGPGTSFDRLRYGNFRVALLDLATRALTILPEQDHGKNLNPVWAPDSRSLVWVNDANGINNLHWFDLQAGKLFRITDLLSGAIGIKDVSPVLSWARDGRLLFTYFERAGYNVYAVGEPRLLPRTPVVTTVAQNERVRSGQNGSDRVQANGNGDPRPDLSRTGPIRPDTVRTAVTSFSRDGTTVRPSDQPVGATQTPPPLSVTKLLDSELGLPDTAQFKLRDYKVKFSTDIVGAPTVGAQVGGFYDGLYGGSYIALSDMLGNHNLVFSGSVNGSFSDASIFTGYSFLKKRANLSFIVEQVPFYRYFGTGRLQLNLDGTNQDVVADVFQRDLLRTAATYISYPLSSFRRIELGATGVYYQSDLLYQGYYESTGELLDRSVRLDDLSYLQPMAALVFDNSMFGWTGPIYGRRYRLQLSRTFGEFDVTEGLLDFRNYANYKQSIVLATRLTALTRVGADANRFAVYWGDPYYIRGYDANSFDPNRHECASSRALAPESSSPCPVRDQLIGSSVAFMNLELRFPIIKVLQIGFLGSFPPVDFVVFADGGIAWDSEICLSASTRDPRSCAANAGRKVNLVWDRKAEQDPFLWREPVFSYGAGLRLNIFYTVLRLDYAIPVNRPDRPSSGVFSLSFGPSF